MRGATAASVSPAGRGTDCNERGRSAEEIALIAALAVTWSPIVALAFLVPVCALVALFVYARRFTGRSTKSRRARAWAPTWARSGSATCTGPWQGTEVAVVKMI
jgi:hypothetical protein